MEKITDDSIEYVVDNDVPLYWVFNRDPYFHGL